MDQLSKEIDYIILLSISRNGFPAMPQDYLFLRRYGLLNLYYEILHRRTNDMNYDSIEKSVKQEALRFLHPVTLFSLRAYRKQHGISPTKALFSNNVCCYRTLLSELRKSNAKIHSDENPESS